MKKQIKRLKSKIKMTNKAIQLFLQQTIKNYNNMKSKIEKIWFLAILLTLAACGSTKVSVDRPAAGTQTTITVTTNNPITTEVNPTTDLNLKGNQQ